MNLKNFMIKAKVANDRGRIWIGYIQFFMLLFITLTSMKSYPSLGFIFEIPYWYIIIGIGGCIGIILIGYIDFKFIKTYQLESETLARLNPVTIKMFKNQDKIIELLETDKIETAKNRGY